MGEPLTVQRIQAPIGQDSGAWQQPAVKLDTLPKVAGEDPVSTEDARPTDLKPVKDLSLDWGGVVGHHLNIQ